MLFIEQALQNNLGAGELSGGLAILAWTFILKLVTSPIYELAIKEPARYSKDKSDFLFEKMEDANSEFNE